MIAPTRRRFLACLTAAAVVPVFRSGRARAHGGDVLLCGGSTLAGGFGDLLVERMAAAGVSAHNAARPATGLARPDYFDWIAHARTLAARHRPRGIVLMFGGNDGQSLKTDDGRWIRWEEEAAWSSAYRARIDALRTALLPNGGPVVWIGYPIVRIPKLRRRLQRINAIAREAMAAAPRATYVDTWSVLAPEGRFTDTLTIGGRRTRVRADDGIHLTVQGARLLAEQVAPRILEAMA